MFIELEDIVLFVPKSSSVALSRDLLCVVLVEAKNQQYPTTSSIILRAFMTPQEEEKHS